MGMGMPIPDLSNLPGVSRPGGGGGGGAPALAQIDNLNSMSFDPASSSYIDLGTDVLFDSTSGFTFSTWVKLEAYSPNAFPPICKIKTDQSTGFVIFLSNNSVYYGVTAGSFLPVLVTKVFKVTKADGTDYTSAEVEKRIIALF